MRKRLKPLTPPNAFYLYTRYVFKLFNSCLEVVRRGVSLLGGSSKKCSLPLAPLCLCERDSAQIEI